MANATIIDCPPYGLGHFSCEQSKIWGQIGKGIYQSAIKTRDLVNDAATAALSYIADSFKESAWVKTGMEIARPFIDVATPYAPTIIAVLLGTVGITAGYKVAQFAMRKFLAMWGTIKNHIWSKPKAQTSIVQRIILWIKETWKHIKQVFKDLEGTSLVTKIFLIEWLIRNRRWRPSF